MAVVTLCWVVSCIARIWFSPSIFDSSRLLSGFFLHTSSTRQWCDHSFLPLPVLAVIFSTQTGDQDWSLTEFYCVYFKFKKGFFCCLQLRTSAYLFWSRVTITTVSKSTITQNQGLRKFQRPLTHKTRRAPWQLHPVISKILQGPEVKTRESLEKVKYPPWRRFLYEKQIERKCVCGPETWVGTFKTGLGPICPNHQRCPLRGS